MGESFFSERFQKNVWLTNHALESMTKRSILFKDVKLLIENGDYKIANENHAWIFHYFPERDDNLICAAIVNEDAIIVKTVMVNWSERGTS